MLKLRKFKEKKLTSKNIMISFVTIIVLLITLVFSKSYAIYKMQKEFDVIKFQIGSFTNGDVKVAVLVDGKETNEFPSYETNYKIESVECTNGVTGSFDVENWQVTISDRKYLYVNNIKYNDMYKLFIKIYKYSKSIYSSIYV